MDKNEAIQILVGAHVGAYSADTPYGERVRAARRFLQEAGHNVVIRSRPGRMGDAPSAMIFVDGRQVA